MKHTPLKRLLAFVLAAMMLLSLAACGDDGGSTNQTVPSITSPTLRQPGTDTTFPHVTEPEATSPSTPSTSDTVTVHAYVPADWTAPCCWAWDDSADAFDAWPGQAMTKNGDWYETQVPSWIANVIISNNGAPQTEDLSVEMGKELWVVVDAAGSTVHYSEPEIYAPADPTPPVSTDVVLEHEDLSYVMIYNPNIYDEYSKWNTTSLATGYLGSQIDVDAHRGGSLEEEPPYTSISQAELFNQTDWEDIDLSGSRGEALGHDYNEGDTKEFFCTTGYEVLDRSELKLTCTYAGKYCYIWTDGSLSNALLEAYGREFDTNIYETMVETFGTPRFVGESGKVNLLFYPFPSNVGGYFYTHDLYSSDELTPRQISYYTANTDHAIVHINSNYSGNSRDQAWTKGVMAHEFQHLLCYTNYFSNYVMCRPWLNEVMSGYTEELIYPGNMELGNRYWIYNNSNRIRKGQSLYNFASDAYDIGVYGSVYYFSEYLVANAGKDVFSKIHDYWRNSYSDTLCEAEAIVNSVPASFKNAIDGFVTYSDSLEFASDDEEWMSKMTLHFYLSMLSKDGGLAAYDHILNSSLLYDELYGTTIEGGGRIILATKDTSFEIPSDADSGLIYIGLDKDFQIVTAYVPQ